MTTTRPVPAGEGVTGRVVSRLAVFVGVSMVAVIVVPALLYPFFRFTTALTGTRLIAFGAMSCAAMLASTAITLRVFGASWRDATRLGVDALGRWPLLGGLAAGWFAIAVPTGLLLWVGALRMIPADAGNWWEATGLAVLMLAPAALTEELMFRGYAFSLLQRAWGAPAAVAATSIAFGAIHVLNPGVSVQALVMVSLAGAFLAVVRLAFDSLWAAWAAHFAYNVVQLAVFHTAVSGIAVPQPFYRTEAVGPAWLTGGVWGPEAGAAAAAGLVGVSFLLAIHAGWARIHRRGWRIDIDVRPSGRKEP